VSFSWNAGGGTQWLDLSLANNGFAEGTYLTAGPIASGQGWLAWEGILAGQTHYWRVTTLGAGGWSVSTTGSFTPCLPVVSGAALPPAAPVGNSLEGQLLQRHNAERSAVGLPPLAFDDRLAQVARVRANDMVSAGYFGHTSPSGQTAFTLLGQYGIPYGLAGENLARNNYPENQSVDTAMTGFMNSATHRANILEGRFTTAGIALVHAGDLKYFVVVYAGP
jgi:uncharacterized protein YkwD